MQRGKKVALAVLVILTVVVLVCGGWMIKHHMDYAITNAVFVDTESIVNVGFQRVGGRIIRMTKREGDPVKKGEVIAEIDPKDYKLAVQALKKELEALKKRKESLEITLKRISSQIKLRVVQSEDKVAALRKQLDATRAELKALDAQIDQVKRDRQRFLNLYKRRVIARRDFEKVDTQLKVLLSKRRALRQKIEALKLELEAARKALGIVREEVKRIEETKKGIEELESRIASLKEKLKDSELLVSYCTLKSPITGRVAKKYVSVGDVVGPGIPVYALVDPKDVFILVLLEETKLKGVKPGCPAKIRIDAIPDEE